MFRGANQVIHGESFRIIMCQQPPMFWMLGRWGWDSLINWRGNPLTSDGFWLKLRSSWDWQDTAMRLVVTIYIYIYINMYQSFIYRRNTLHVFKHVTYVIYHHFVGGTKKCCMKSGPLKLWTISATWIPMKRGCLPCACSPGAMEDQHMDSRLNALHRSLNALNLI